MGSKKTKSRQRLDKAAAKKEQLAKFGGWRKENRKQVWRPQEGHPYVVTLSCAEDAYTATLTGDQPQLLHTVDRAGQTDKQAIKAAQVACEEHWVEAPERKPRREKGTWPVRVMPSPQLLAELAPKQAGNTREIARLKGEIADSAEAHKKLKKEKEGEIEEIEETQGRLADEVEHGVTTTLECYRERVGDEWVFTSEDGTEIDRQPAADGAQQKLVSDFAAPRAWQDLQRTALVLELLGRGYPPEGQRQTNWPLCEMSWHPLVARLQERLHPLPGGEGYDQERAALLADLDAEAKRKANRPMVTDGVRQPGNEQADIEVDDALDPVEITFPRGSTVSHCGRYSLRKQSGLWCPCVGADGEIDLPRAAAHTSKRDAVAQCQQHLDSRIRWGKPVLSEHDGEPCSLLSVPVDGQPSYQLTRQMPDVLGRDWQAERVGRLDEDNTALAPHKGLKAAQVACQRDADALRADGGGA